MLKLKGSPGPTREVVSNVKVTNEKGRIIIYILLIINYLLRIMCAYQCDKAVTKKMMPVKCYDIISLQ